MSTEIVSILLELICENESLEKLDEDEPTRDCIRIFLNCNCHIGKFRGSHYIFEVNCECVLLRTVELSKVNKTVTKQIMFFHVCPQGSSCSCKPIQNKAVFSISSYNTACLAT